jgi:outer membrane protein OmpA-like peptidoglycan-associated protein
MTCKSSVWALGVAVALAAPAWAQTTGTPIERESGTVLKEEVKTWVTEIDGKEYSIRPTTPSYAGDTGLFHLSSAYTLPKGKWSASLFRDNYDRDPKDIDFSIHGLTLAYGVTPRLELFGSVGIQNRVDTDALQQAGFYNDLPFIGHGLSSTAVMDWQSGFGDVKLGAKYKLLDDYVGGDPVALAIKGFVKLPTADENKGLGTGKVSGGLDLLLSKHLNKKADVHFGVGYQINGDPAGANIGNAFKWGVGLNVPSCKLFQIQADLVGTKYSGGSTLDNNKMPVDLVVGPVVWLKGGFFVRPAISWNLNFDGVPGRGMKSYTGRQIAIGFHPGTPCCKIFVPPPPPPPPANRMPTVACEIEKSLILPGETVRCHAAASDPDGDALAYQWSASAGRVSGTGADATFDSAGVPAGSTVTITVSVSDGRGGTAQSRCTVKLEEPKRAPEAITCTSGGFPRNLARLNNIDKACLDDVALRMKQDPQGRVVIVGHADKTERFPEVTARKRAEAIKDYLVKQGGADAARITVRSAGATKPLDTGKTMQARAKNRRCDVVYVPAGAVLPEGL